MTPPHRSLSREEYTEALVPLATLYVEAVHDAGPTVRDEVLAALADIPAPDGVHPAHAFFTVLAAMVDPDSTVTQRLAWVTRHTPVTTARIPVVNPFAVELALAGWLTAAQLTEDQARQVVTELALNRSWTPSQIVDHLDADPKDVTRWTQTVRARRSRKNRTA